MASVSDSRRFSTRATALGQWIAERKNTSWQGKSASCSDFFFYSLKWFTTRQQQMLSQTHMMVKFKNLSTLSCLATTACSWLI
jgi:hypothetical protein